MSRFKKIDLACWIFTAAMFVFGFVMKTKLPDMIPTHFSPDGTGEKFASTFMTVLFLPSVTVFSLLLLNYLAKTNKLFWEKEFNKESVALTNLGIVALIFLMYSGALLNAFDFQTFGKYSFFAIGFGLFFVLSAPAMKNITRNLFYGIRSPWSLKSDNNWTKTHSLASKIMLPMGVALIVIGFLTKNSGLILGIIFFTLTIPMIYSFKIRE